MENAILYGFLSGFALLLGSIIGIFLKIPKRTIAFSIMCVY